MVSSAFCGAQGLREGRGCGRERTDLTDLGSAGDELLLLALVELRAIFHACLDRLDVYAKKAGDLSDTKNLNGEARTAVLRQCHPRGSR